MVKLQLALDYADIDEAIGMADSVAQYVDWMEVGTPLIKSEGLIAIEEIKKSFPTHKIVADMKTMDTGALETQLAAEAGAHVTTVCAAADEQTIKAAINEGRSRDIIVVVDTLNTPSSRWSEIDRMRPDYICIHVGIDQQKKGLDPLDLLKKQKLKSPLIVAGGMNAKRVPAAMQAGAQVIIVGAAITNAINPEQAAKEISEAMDKASKEILLYGRE